MTQAPSGLRHISEIVAGIAERVARLSIDRRDPEAFFIRKSDLAHELRTVAQRLGSTT